MPHEEAGTIQKQSLHLRKQNLISDSIQETPKHQEENPLDRLIQLDERFQRSLTENSAPTPDKEYSQLSNVMTADINTENIMSPLHPASIESDEDIDRNDIISTPVPTFNPILDHTSQFFSSYALAAHAASNGGQPQASPWSPTWLPHYHSPFTSTPDSSAAAAFFHGYGSAAASLMPQALKFNAATAVACGASSPTQYSPYLAAVHNPFSGFISSPSPVAPSTETSTMSPTSISPPSLHPPSDTINSYHSTQISSPPPVLHQQHTHFKSNCNPRMTNNQPRRRRNDGSGKMAISAKLSKKLKSEPIKLQPISRLDMNLNVSNRNTNRTNCDCPNCKELQKAGIPMDKKKEKHSCHIPGCHKVYGKSSHLKAHLRWHSIDRPAVARRFTHADLQNNFIDK